MVKQKLDSLQLGRGFAALAVLAFHTNLTIGLARFYGKEPIPILGAGDSGVAYFFVLSGFVMMLAHRGDAGRIDRLPNFIWRRFQRIYPMLWVALTLTLPFKMMYTHIVPDFGTVVGAFTIAPFPQDEHILGVEWTLRREVVFYGVFSLYLCNKKAGLIAIVSWTILSLVVPLLSKNPSIQFYFFPIHALFAVGIIAFHIYRLGNIPNPKAFLVAGVMAFATLWVVYGLGYVEKNLYMGFSYGLASALIILGSVGVEIQRQVKIWPPLLFLGEASYSIYLIHFPVVTATSSILYKYHSSISSSAAFFIVATVAVIAGALLHIYIERPIIKGTKNLIEILRAYR